MAIGSAIAGIAAIGGSVLGASAQKKAANKAADVSLQVAEKNNALAREIYGKNEATLNPYVTRGNAAGDAYNALLGLGGNTAAAQNAFSNYQNSTGYQFRMDQGMDALNSGYAANGLLNSGAARKASIEFGQNLGSSEFGNYLGYLGNQQGVGLSGASALAGVGNNYVNSVSANNNSAGSAAANAALMKGTATANMFSGIGGGIGNILGNVFGSSF